MRIYTNQDGFSHTEKRMKRGMSPVIPRAVFLTTAYLEKRAKSNIDKVIYQRSVSWRRTGKAKQSIVGQKISEDTGKVFVGVDYGKHIEYGTKPHVITPKKANGILAWKVSGQWRYAKKVNHPGTKPYPFWKPAIKKTKKEAPLILKKVVKEFDTKN